MEKFYWYDTCKNCSQGRLVIMKDMTNDRLYLHCDECEMGWLRPEDSQDISKGFLTLLEDFDAEAPDLETIKSYGWEQYAKHSFCMENGEERF